MSERQTHNPEASPQTIADLYKQAADYLETMLHAGKAAISPALIPHQITAAAEVPELNGKSLRLEYDRANSNEDSTQVDMDIPLAYVDETGENQWQTPIRIAVYSQDESLLHDYSVEYAGKNEWTRVTDKKLQPGQDLHEYGSITSLDAKELIGQLEWAFEAQFPHE